MGGRVYIFAEDLLSEGSTSPPENTSPVGTTSAPKNTWTRSRNSIVTTNPSATAITDPLPMPKFWQELCKSTQDMWIPARLVGKPPGVLQNFKSILCASCLNILLICIPVAWAIHWAVPESNVNRDALLFTSSFFAIIPLAKFLGFATEELSLRVGQTLAGFMNVTLGNAVDLIVAIIALIKCKLWVVQTSLVGSVISNLLLVLGMCFFAGGLKHSEQVFGVSATLNTTLLNISIIAVLLPTAFHFSVTDRSLADAQEAHDVFAISHNVAVILLFIYAGYLAFQLHSSPNFDPHRARVELEEKEEARPQLGLWTAIGLLVAVTILVVITAEWLVESIDGFTSSRHIRKEFVGLILLPIVGNTAKYITAVKASVKDGLNLRLGVALGSSIQMSLFVIPFIVILGWILGKHFTLLFDPYQSVTMFLSVLTVNYVIQNGKSTWLEGFILICFYLILAVTFWFYPDFPKQTDTRLSGVLKTCTK